MSLTKRYLAGHTGLVGSALVRRWAGQPSTQLVTATHAELELTDPLAVQAWLTQHRPNEIIIAAGKVGGIAANASEPVAFLQENLMIEVNLIRGAWQVGVKRLVNLGSSCMYPKHCPQPMRPEHLMTGPMEPTSEPYAMAKWIGLSLCQSYNRQYGTRFITAIPCTIYGPGDHFDPDTAHVLSALIRKCHDAKGQGERAVTLWGTGTARREFVYADDVAEACEVLLERYEETTPVNIGPGQGVAAVEPGDVARRNLRRRRQLQLQRHGAAATPHPERDGIADSHIQPLDLTRIVERRMSDRNPTDCHRIHDRHRRERARPPHLHLDAANDRRRLSRSKFEGD